MQDPKGIAGKDANEVAEYEAPRVESVVTADDVEREAHYGGLVSMN